MTSDDAARILEALAKGIDPETGEFFPENSPLNSPHIIRALFLGAKALQEGAPVVAATKRVVEEGLEHAWKPWTAEEEERLAAAFGRGDSINSIAEAHRRKPGGITSRLIRLGLIERAGVAKSDA